MKTVASSKMPIYQAKAEQASPFFLTMNEAFKSLGQPPATGKDLKLLTLVICTDKGLCGSTNNNLTRSLIKSDMSAQSIVIWGDKGCGAFENSQYRQNVRWSAHPNPKGGLSFIEISHVVEQLMKEEYDVVRIVFNRLIKAGVPAIDTLYIPSYKALSADEAKEVRTLPSPCPPRSPSLLA